MICRGIRGATTVTTNSKEAIIEATTEMLNELVSENGFNQEDIAGVWFTTTPDLDAEFPAVAARVNLGWVGPALINGHEIAVPGSLPMCIRVLLLVNTQKAQNEIKFVYLRGAVGLRDRDGKK
ncbi:MAG: chorismate mutase [Chloroflexi bacterium]|nr:chorismate mutase [Chloroflexota bacterium]